MNRKSGSIYSWALLVVFALATFVAPSVFAVPVSNNTLTTVSVQSPSSQCAGSFLNQYSNLSVNSLCWSGSASSSYVPFSATLLQIGSETYVNPMGQSPTLEILNDTSSTTISFRLSGTIAAATPITCVGANGSTGCSISGSAGTFGDAANGATGATYPAESDSTPWTASLTLTYYGVALNSYVGLKWSGWSSTSQSSITLGGQVPTFGAPISSCGGGSSTTTVTGKVYVPNGKDPLPNALIYVPSTDPGPLQGGVLCVTQANQAQGNPVTYTYSAYDGTFTLKNVPAGVNIPIVIQSGKWRIQRVISTVTACTSNPAPAAITTLPSNQYAGDIPQIAMVTGSVDALECVLRKTGLADSEFTNPTSSGFNGRINIYLGTGAGSGSGSPGAGINSSTPKENVLFTANSAGGPTGTNLDKYDMVMMACQGAQYVQPATDVALMTAWTNAGGRLFTTHYSYVWLNSALNASPWDAAQGPETAMKWSVNQSSPTPDPGTATINTGFTSGATLANWMQTIGASTTLGQVSLNTLRLDHAGIVSPTQSWLTLNQNKTSNEIVNPDMQVTFNTPVGAQGSQQCGRVLFNDYHVYNASGLGGQNFPAECNTNAMTAQEHLLEYALFDLTQAIVPVTSATASQSYQNTPTVFMQGDGNDSIAIVVTNTSTSIALGSDLTVNATLPTGVTVNTTSFSSGGWSCTAASGGSTFTCTRTTNLAAGANDTIDIPVAVAADAPLGTGGSLTSTVSGGGLAASVNGTDPLNIKGVVTLACAANTVGEVGVHFSAQMSAAGGTAPYTYAVASGTLPAGLSLNASTGLISGTPTTAGSFTVMATDSQSNVATSTCPISINSALTATCAATTSGEVGLPFSSGAMSVSGGTAPYTFSVVGTLPTGLTLNATTGEVGGTPMASGSFSVKVTDAAGASSSACGIAINAVLSVTCAAKTKGTVGVAFDSGAITVAGGSAPYTYAIVGTLPAGLTLNTTTGAVTGAATVAGSFSVQVTDASGAKATACAIAIAVPDGEDCKCAFGIGSAFNLIALTGDISDQADITGRIAVAGQVTQATTIGTDLRTADPYLTLATQNGGPFAIVAAGGIPTSNSFNVNAGGNVYSATPTNANFNFANENYSGSPYANSTLITGGTSPIDFAMLNAQMDTLSSQLAGLAVNGVVCAVDNFGAIIPDGGCPANPTYFSNTQHYNPSWLVLYGTSKTANVFTLTQEQFQNANKNLDIEVPSGSTVIVNVAGQNDTLQSGVYFQGQTATDAQAGNILFNFANASTVTINGSFFGTLLAPYAYLSGNSQMGGMFIAASIGSTGEVHYDPFTGILPLSGNCGSVALPLSVACAANTTGEVGVAFNSGAMTVTGGTAPYTYSVVGTLPAGLTLDTTNGTITGTAMAAGSFSVQVTDAKSAISSACPISISAAPSIACAANTVGQVGVAFDSGAMTVTGGATPYVYSVVGTLPAGLLLNAATGQVTGTPTAAGSFSVKVTDANGAVSTGCAITINAALSATCAATTVGEVGVAFNSGAMTVTGGTAPYTYSVVGTLPAGLTLNTSTGAITGTATAAGPFTVKVTDANGATSTGCSITINAALSATCAATTVGEVGVAFNSGPMTVSGGTAPYTYSVVGTLPAGLTLNTSTGAITGTAIAAGSFTVKVTDANGATSTGCSITINAALSATCAATTVGEVGVAFNSGPMTVTGGTAPYTYSVVGTLPAGLTLNTTTGAITGTATAAGSFTVKVTDANGASSTGCSITINAALSATCAATTVGEVGVAFNSGPMTVSGGTAPYTYSVVGTLPAGLTLNTSTGAITGTATAAGSFTVKVTDANGASSTGCSITINAALSATCAATTVGEVGVAFNSGPMTVSGGTAPYTYSVVGTLPAGLTLNTSTGAITGSATAAGSFTVKVTDANGATSTGCSITINAALSATCAATTVGEVGVAFNSGPMTVSGGTAPYTYSVVGTLPAGLTLNTSTGAITGTATAAGSFTVKVTDANGASSTGCSITINAALSATCAATTVGEVGVAFNSGPMTVSGGTAPYTYSVVGTLPAGLTLNTSTGAITGSATAAGSFTVKVTDANGATSTGCSITINAALSATCAATTVGEVGVAFNSGPMTVSGGTAPYTYSVVGTLPAGLTLNTSTGAITGSATAAGSFTVKVTDANGATSTGCSITINAALSATCAATTSGTVGVAFNSGSMTAIGGTAPYTYSVVGTLPAGLTLNTSTGAITGTATATGSFAVKVTDAVGVSSAGCAITIVQASENSSCAFGVASAYNMMALTGDINDGVDITGRIAARGRVLQATTIGSDLRKGDPYIALASENGGPYAIVAGGGIPTSNQFWVNAGGNVYSSTSTSANFGLGNENYSGSLYAGSTLVTGGTSPIDFATLTSEMNSLSAKLAALSSTGVICTVDNSGYIVSGGGCPSSSQHYNPSWLLLYGTDATTNVFNITQAQLQGNHNLDLEVPAGSTVIVNVAGTSDKLSNNILFKGVTVADANAGNILFNFPDAKSVTINAQFDGVLLAPGASLSSTNQMGGIFIAASIASTNEMHYDPFLGSLPISGACSNSSVPFSITCAATTTGEVGVAFSSGSIAVTGGKAPYTYSVVGTLPAGLLLNSSTGAISGTPTASGSFSVKVTDAAGLSRVSCPITINAALSVTWGTSSTGTVGTAFNSGTPTSSGGTTPYTYSIVGTLPAGLSLNASTGVVTGTPTCSGSFSVKVTDAEGATSTSSAITINPSASAGYTMTVNPSTLTVQAGKSATTTFTFTPTGGYVGTVAFSCTGLPAGATCTFVPPSVTADGTNKVQTSTLTVTTTRSGTTTVAQKETNSRVSLAGFFFVPALLLGGFITVRRRQFTARTRGALLALLMGVAMMGGAIGCGANFIQTITPLGSHVVTVQAKTTATSSSSSGSSVAQSATFTLIVTE